MSITHLRNGKVRDIYSYEKDKLLIVTTDRISAFDVILPSMIPGRGIILTQISKYWFDMMKVLVPNHIIPTSIPKEVVDELSDKYDEVENRTMFVYKTQPLKVECIVRGYLSGSGWKDYQANGKVCGIGLPKGLQESSQLPEPVYTPSTKADEGHDKNISFADTIDILGNEELAFQLRNLSLAIYKIASSHARERGIIIADTKFEFGIINDKLVLIDEILTPDSSRFWDIRLYQPGRSQDSFDKQIIRDYLNTLTWNKQSPGPKLPDNIINKTLNRYNTIVNRLKRTW